MTPECLIIPPNLRASQITKDESVTVFKQIRACLTLVDREELWVVSARDISGSKTKSHADLFGEFAIGLDPIEARSLGATPVIYFYRGLDGANVSMEILYNLWELRSLAIAVARIEAKAERRNYEVSEEVLDDYGYVLKDDPAVERRINNLSKARAGEVLECLETVRRPAWNMVDLIESTLDFRQTADSRSSDTSLEYFQQREWRITRVLARHLGCYNLALENGRDGDESEISLHEKRAIRDRIRAVNADFFTTELLNESSLMWGTKSDGVEEGRRFFDFVRELICPSEVEGEVDDMLVKFGFGGCFSVEGREHGAVVFQRREAV